MVYDYLTCTECKKIIKIETPVKDGLWKLETKSILSINSAEVFETIIRTNRIKCCEKMFLIWITRNDKLSGVNEYYKFYDSKEI